MALGAGVQTQVDAVVGVEAFGAEVEAGFLHLAQQVGLGEGRALVGGHGFVAEERDVALEPLGAEFGHERGARLSAADDHDAHARSLPVWPSAGGDAISRRDRNAMRGARE